MSSLKDFFQPLEVSANLVTHFYKRYKIRILTTSLLVILFVVLATKTDIFLSFLSKPTLTEGIVGTYTMDSLPVVVTSLLSEPLVRLDKTGSPSASIALSWSSNDNARIWEFKIKEGSWIDGSKIFAKDLAVSMPEAKVKVKNNNTLVFELADSFSPFPSMLTKPVFKESANFGTGPYFIDFVETDQIFIRKISLKTNKENLPNVVIKFYPDEKTAKNALKIGEVQSLLGLHSVLEFEKEGPFVYYNKPNFNRIVAIFYNTKDPILSDRNFRLALSFAAPSIDKEMRAKTFVYPLSWAFNPDVKDFLDNKDLAKEYLDKVEKGKDEKITLTATANLKEVGEKIVKEWRNLGVNALLRVESGVPQNFQVLLITQEVNPNIPLDPDQYSLWHSTQTINNISQYSSGNQYSPRVDKDLEDGRKLIDYEIRKERYFDLQKVLLDDAPATPLYFPKYNVVALKKILPHLQKVTDLQFEDMHLNF